MQALCFLSLNDFTKPSLPTIANGFIELGFTIVATTGMDNLLKMEGIPVERVLKLHEGCPHIGDMMANGQIQLMVIENLRDIGTTNKEDRHLEREKNRRSGNLNSNRRHPKHQCCRSIDVLNH